MKTLRVPFQIDSRGGLAFTEETQQIVRQQIADIVSTADFERLMNPHYGAAVPNFLFSPMLPLLMSAKADEVKARLEQSIQLASIVSVTMQPTPGRQATVTLDIKYSISPSPEVFTMEHTVSGMITDETFGSIV